MRKDNAENLEAGERGGSLAPVYLALAKHDKDRGIFLVFLGVCFSVLALPDDKTSSSKTAILLLIGIPAIVGGIALYVRGAMQYRKYSDDEDD